MDTNPTEDTQRAPDELSSVTLAAFAASLPNNVASVPVSKGVLVFATDQSGRASALAFVPT